MDHLREFGLSRDPFVNDPVPGLYYQSAVHHAAERRLGRAIAQHKGLCVLVGDPGAGKSMLARRVLEQLGEEAFEASLLLIVQSSIDARGLLARVATRLGVENPAEEPLGILAQAYDRLSAFREEGRRPVVIVDDAHQLATRELMQALRALLDLEYEDHHLLSLVLVGQPVLDRVLALDPALPPRLDVRVRLDALDLPSTAAYLGHRITNAGGHPLLMKPDAVEAIHSWGRGLPRRINVLADNALFEAHLERRTQVRAEDVERAARELGYDGVDVAALADAMPPRAGSKAPGGEPIDLTQEVRPGGRSWDDTVPAFDDAEKEPEEAPVFDMDGGSEIVVDAGEDGVDRDVDDVFDHLIDRER